MCAGVDQRCLAVRVVPCCDGAHHCPLLPLSQTKFCEASAQQLFRTLTETVHFCHQEGIVHRDLKVRCVARARCVSTSAVSACRVPTAITAIARVVLRVVCTRLFVCDFPALSWLLGCGALAAVTAPPCGVMCN